MVAAITSQIILGREHPNDGGINNSPIGFLQLSEGNRPYWAYKPTTKKYQATPICIGMYPTIDNTIDDAFLYFAITQKIIENPSTTFLNFIAKFQADQTISMLDMPHKIRNVLYTETKMYSHLLPKTIITVFTPDSLIAHQTNQLLDYKNSMALLIPKYVRDIDNWTTRPKIYGNL